MKTQPQEKGIRLRNGIWYANIQVDGKRREFRVGPKKEDALALRSRLKLMSPDGTLQAHLKKQEAPPVFVATEVTAPPDTAAVAVGSVPQPPVNTTAGALEYPVPPAVTLTCLT